MISGIRNYVDARIKEIDPNLEAWTEDAFGNNDIQTSIAQAFYKLFYGSLTNERQGSVVNDSLPIFIDIWATNVRRDDVLGSYDALYQKAFDIYKNIVDIRKIKGNESDFTTIQLVSIEPIEEETSDNTFKMRIELNTVKSFCY